MSNQPTQKRYKVKDASAVFVAGVRIDDDRTVLLFEDAARYELLAGNLEEFGPGKAVVSSVSKPVKPAVEA
jgi:hypothetical protein